MRPRARATWLFTACVLLAGCGNGRRSAHYGWLRLQGARNVEQSTWQPTDTATWNSALTAIRTTPEAPGDVLDAASNEEASLQPGPGPLDPRPAARRNEQFGPAAVILAPDSTDYYEDRPHPWNKMAVASLPITVIGVGIAIAFQSTLVLGLAGLIGFTLALWGGRRARDREQRGRGFAMPAMIIGAVALFLVVLVVISGL